MTPEFAFERTDEGTGTLTYRCMAFTIERDEGGDFTESDLQFLASIVHTLNGFYCTPEQARFQDIMDAEGDDG